ncbi:diaminopimelate epimerase [Coprococcus sp. OM04-5BH]|jgi:diaminopimelate epimerase|uniref:diaminopimelate epimerase n=1 Tax=Coprococcus sp. OM04-5BH TaxID=2293093 RepID=UPI000E4FC135|nr:diaminopimelate epimerase [Coprococcus sp. OM04-5BH]RHV30982.1 diaminopimelate epimerase [Coprococcus sp. OM04-5BH]
MKFTKMQGLGNDYVYVNCFEEKIENPSELAVKVSDRHFGIGSDGLILIRPSEVADFRMTMFNADGSESEMCGNGIRCVGKYVYDYGLTDKTEVSVETLAGIKYLKFLIKDGKVDMVTVNMGEPILKPELVPVVGEGDSVIDSPIEVDGKEYKMTCVSMGNPHSVVFVDDVDNFPLHEVGPLFEHHKAFPRRVNAEFCQVIDRTHAKMRVWERGTGETLACGTGTCATAVACILNGKTEDEVTITLLGGDLIIRWDREKNVIYMTGPARVVFDGEIDVTAL